jgi:hypothetical protein
MQPNHPFTSPIAPGGGEAAPRPRDMQGCLVAYSPKLITLAGAPGNTTGVGGSDPRDRVTTDLYLLESPAPVIFGGSPEYERDPKPHTHSVMGPAKFSSVWVSNSNIVRALAPGGQVLAGHMVLGRIVRSDIGNKPFNLVDVAGTPDMDRAIGIWSQLQMGALHYNEPTPLPGYAPVAAPAQQVNYAPPAAAPPVADPFQQWLATQAAAAVPQPADVPPPGWTAAGWASLSADQKAQVRAVVNQPR